MSFENLASSDLFQWQKMRPCKIRATSCYDINVKCTYFLKDGLLKSLKFKFKHVFSFSCIYKKDDKVLAK